MIPDAAVIFLLVVVFAVGLLLGYIPSRWGNIPSTLLEGVILLIGSFIEALQDKKLTAAEIAALVNQGHQIVEQLTGYIKKK